MRYAVIEHGIVRLLVLSPVILSAAIAPVVSLVPRPVVPVPVPMVALPGSMYGLLGVVPTGVGVVLVDPVQFAPALFSEVAISLLGGVVALLGFRRLQQ